MQCIRPLYGDIDLHRKPTGACTTLDATGLSFVLMVLFLGQLPKTKKVHLFHFLPKKKGASYNTRGSVIRREKKIDLFFGNLCTKCIRFRLLPLAFTILWHCFRPVSSAIKFSWPVTHTAVVAIWWRCGHRSRGGLS